MYWHCFKQLRWTAGTADGQRDEQMTQGCKAITGGTIRLALSVHVRDELDATRAGLHQPMGVNYSVSSVTGSAACFDESSVAWGWFGLSVW